MRIALATSKTDIEHCYPVMVQLRTTLSKEDFITRVTKQQKEGYQLAYVMDQHTVVACAGFRIMNNLVSGKFLFVDDLITDSLNRSKGYGDALFDWLVALAKKEGCKELHLDSGVQRFDAHRFYLRKRLSISAHHFMMNIPNT